MKKTCCFETKEPIKSVVSNAGYLKDSLVLQTFNTWQSIENLQFDLRCVFVADSHCLPRGLND